MLCYLIKININFKIIKTVLYYIYIGADMASNPYYYDYIY